MKTLRERLTAALELPDHATDHEIVLAARDAYLAHKWVMRDAAKAKAFVASTRKEASDA